jgi:hypothetical protein
MSQQKKLETIYAKTSDEQSPKWFFSSALIFSTLLALSSCESLDVFRNAEPQKQFQSKESTLPTSKSEDYCKSVLAATYNLKKTNESASKALQTCLIQRGFKVDVTGFMDVKTKRAFTKYIPMSNKTSQKRLEMNCNELGKDLKTGDIGYDVFDLQSCLRNQRSLHHEPVQVTGYYGPKTYTANQTYSQAPHDLD